MTAHLAAEPDLVWLAAAAVVLWWLNRRGRLRSITRRAGRLAAAVVAVVLAATVSTSAVVVVVLVVACLAVGGRHTRRHYRRQAQLSRWFWQGYNRAAGNRRRLVRRHRLAVPLPDDYTRHMASSRWRRQRLRVLARDNHRCRACRSGYRLEGHHKAYTTPIGNEPDSWVVTLCQPCHRTVSDLHQHRGYSVEAATEMVLRRAVHAA